MSERRPRLGERGGGGGEAGPARVGLADGRPCCRPGPRRSRHERRRTRRPAATPRVELRRSYRHPPAVSRRPRGLRRGGEARRTQGPAARRATSRVRRRQRGGGESAGRTTTAATALCQAPQPPPPMPRRGSGPAARKSGRGRGRDWEETPTARGRWLGRERHWRAPAGHPRARACFSVAPGSSGGCRRLTHYRPNTTAATAAVRTRHFSGCRQGDRDSPTAAGHAGTRPARAGDKKSNVSGQGGRAVSRLSRRPTTEACSVWLVGAAAASPSRHNPRAATHQPNRRR